MVCEPGCISVVLLDIQIGLVIFESVNDMQSLTVIGADDLMSKWQSNVCNVIVDRDAAPSAKVARISVSVSRLYGNLDAHSV